MQIERGYVRLRFWIEAFLAISTSFFLILTLIWKDWIELVSGIDPDSGNGSVERLVVTGLLIATIGFFSLAGFEWRKTHFSRS